MFAESSRQHVKLLLPRFLLAQAHRCFVILNSLSKVNSLHGILRSIIYFILYYRLFYFEI